MINILFMGRKPISVNTLNWLTQRNDVHVVAVITDSHLEISPTRTLANKLSIPVLTRKIVEKKIARGELSVDLAISVLYWQKIRSPILKHCPKGVINFHPAPLPDYKGTGGYNLAILEGHRQWAVSAHYVDENIDTGPIIDVDYFDIDPDHETAQSLEAKTQPKLFAQIKRVLDEAIKSDQALPSHKKEGGKYISRKKMEDMKKIVAGDNIERKIRAFWFPPYDGAYIDLNGIRCTLVSQQILQSLGNPETSNLFTPQTPKKKSE